MSSEVVFKNVEQTTSTLLRVTYPFVVRVDGRGFSSRFNDMKRALQTTHAPFSLEFEVVMNTVASRVAKEFGATITERHSDEISFVWLAPSDTATPPYGGKIQKLASLVASMTTAVFNSLMNPQGDVLDIFDGRVLQLSVEGPTTPRAYLLHRSLSASRNWIAEWTTTQMRLAGLPVSKH